MTRSIHIPKSYVERIKRTVPRKIYGTRFGAPAVTRYHLLPEDYIPSTEGRPWEHQILTKIIQKENRYHSKVLKTKYHEFQHNNINKIPDEEWTIFPGDTVQVMVGKHKGKSGIVLKVLREANAVFVGGLHTKLETEMDNLQKYGLKKMFKWVENALDASKEEVMLVDPQEKEPCTANWVLNESKTEWIRVSNKTGVEIPLPYQAKVTYEYISPKDYIEVEGKDTTSNKGPMACGAFDAAKMLLNYAQDYEKYLIEMEQRKLRIERKKYDVMLEKLKIDLERNEKEFVRQKQRRWMMRKYYITATLLLPVAVLLGYLRHIARHQRRSSTLLE